jgi:hydroxymethylpyrimidine/phosphomethylpyrimidine kinase
MSVITALTAQNTIGVTGIHPVPIPIVEKQMEAVFTDIGTDAVKIGMLYSVELIETVARNLKQFKPNNIVLDPVMIAQSGDKLIQDEAIDAIRELLMPLTNVVTPNLPEAEVLIGRKIDSHDDIQNAVKELAKFGSQSILIKGGHVEGNESTDIFYMPEEERLMELSGSRINTKNNHGTGCTLSSAIAANLAKGYELSDAVTNAKNYIKEAIKAGAKYSIGNGNGPVHHFYKFWDIGK